MHKSTIAGKIWFATVIGLISFSTFAQKPKLTGYIKGVNDKPIVFGYSQKGEDYKDTVYAKNVHFVYFPKPPEDGMIRLTINPARSMRFWYEPGDIDITGFVEKPYALIVKGGTENNILTLYNSTISWPYVDKMNNSSASERKIAIEDKRKARLILLPNIRMQEPVRSCWHKRLNIQIRILLFMKSCLQVFLPL